MGYRAGGARGAEGLGGGDGPGAVAGSARRIPAGATATAQTGCGSAAGGTAPCGGGPAAITRSSVTASSWSSPAENAAGASTCVVDSQWAWTTCD